MTGWKLLILAYACFYALFVYWMVGDNLSIEYPLPYVVWSASLQLLVAAGVLAYALDRGATIVPIWRWLFPVLVVDAMVGIGLDAVVPADFNLAKDGMAWIANLLLNVWFAAPAYYLNFKVAYRGGGQDAAP